QAYRSITFEVRRRLSESIELRELGGANSNSGEALVTLAQAMNLPVPLPEDEPAASADELSPPGPPPRSAQEDSPQPAPQPAAVPVVETSTVSVPAAKEPPRTVTAPAVVEATGSDSPQEAGAAEVEAPAQVTAPSDSGCHGGLLKTRQRSCTDALAAGGDGPRMAIVKPGSFTMGSEWAPEEGPPHAVAIGAPFGIAAHEVSHDEYQQYCSGAGARCPDNPWSTGDYPVVNVSWDEASAYANWLSAQTGRRYRLPTEAEWEFAARAGVESRYPFGDELLPVQARYASGLGAEEPWPRSYRDAPRNAFGLYNSIGNVREWVADAWHASHSGAPADGGAREGNGARVVRGGSFADEATALRLSSRMPLDGSARDEKTGFRIALDFGETPD
ncbi:MAG: SUMF1/EgtB/PvdO family nonheme iron enzyme, partial [Pseudomonadota bacterium]